MAAIDALVNDRKTRLTCSPKAPSTLIWLNEGGREQWRRGKAERKTKDEQRKQARREQTAAEAIKNHHDQGDHFINPYTFVPLPDQIDRSEPSGHDALKPGAVSGWFTWQLTFKTPLVYPVEDLPTTKDDSIIYPGSALRGALRNLHESLTGSCLRILDDEYLPVHREPMSAGTRKLCLAIVEDVDPVTGDVRRIRHTDDLVWVDEAIFPEEIKKSGLYSGRKIGLKKSEAKKSVNNRMEIRQNQSGETITDGEEWVLHLSSMTSERDKLDNHYFIAAGHLSDEYEELDPGVWEEFQRLCAGSQDLTGEKETGNKDDPNTSFYQPGSSNWPGVEVRKQKRPVGRRRIVDGRLAVGDTVWVERTKRTKHLKMATIWRYPGKHPVSERMNKDFKPCHHPEHLCPSCAVFGSVDTRTLDEKKKDASGRSSVEQAGYASHVRVGWAYSTTKPSRKGVDIAPLRSPKPSSGGFYLMYSDKSGPASTKDYHIPHAHWGSESDKPEPRMIRGRKYYWHGQADDEAGPTRQIRRGSQANDGQATVATEGLVLETKVSFDNLTRKQLGWLLAAADPNAFFNAIDDSHATQQNEYWIHLGRGKPLGYGSTKPEVIDLHVQTAQTRYSTTEDASLTVTDLIDVIRSSIPDELSDVHNALKRVLAAHPDNVHADRIWYPTVENFKNVDTSNFDKSFEWFSKHSGGRPPKGDEYSGKLVYLPDSVDDNQYIVNRARPEKGS